MEANSVGTGCSFPGVMKGGSSYLEMKDLYLMSMVWEGSVFA